MHTRESLLRQIKEMGIKEDDLITFHISLKSMGDLDTAGTTGADLILDSFLECLPNGLLLVPSHTFRNVREIAPIYDVRNTMPCIGTLPRIAVERARDAYDRGDRTCIRSMHPAHSVVAFGKKAYEYTADDAKACSPMPEFGSYRKLLPGKGKILMIGVPLRNCTYIHAIDEYMEPNGVSKPYPVTAIDYEGAETLREVRNCRGPSGQYGKYMPILQETNSVSFHKLGDADVILCDVEKMFAAITSVWKELNPR